MAHKASIVFDENKRQYQILSLDYCITQKVNSNMVATHFPQFSQFSMTLLAQDNTDLFFYEWMNNLKDNRNATIWIDVVNKGKLSAKTLVLYNAHPTFVKENYNFLEEKQMTIQLTLSCEAVAFELRAAKDTARWQNENLDQDNSVFFSSSRKYKTKETANPR